MKSGYMYGLWGFIELWVFPANGIGGHQNPWGITGYGFPRRWVRTESTVHQQTLDLLQESAAVLHRHRSSL